MTSSDQFFDALKAGDDAAVGGMLAADPALVRTWSPDGYTALHFAAWLGHRDLAAALLDAGADVSAVARNEARVQPLHSAAAGRHAPVVALLLARGAEANARQHGGVAPLHSSAHGGDPESVRLLLKAGADPLALTDDGKSPRDLAHHSKRAELILALLEASDRR